MSAGQLASESERGLPDDEAVLVEQLALSVVDELGGQEGVVADQDEQKRLILEQERRD